MTRVLAIAAAVFTFAGSARAEEGPWVVFPGAAGPGHGKNVVLIAADDEYRSEELIPALARVLATRHGFHCTVLFAIDPSDGTIDPTVKDNVPGLEALKTADLLVFFARFRELPDDQMKMFLDYVESGRPIVALRTSTHPFNYERRKDSPYARYDWRSKEPKGGFGRLVFGETWVSHWGKHNVESTRGLIAPGARSHPIARGLDDIWGPSDVYEVHPPEGRFTPIVLGQVLQGMKPTDPPNSARALMPIAWTTHYTGAAGVPARIFVTTMGHGGDFECEDVRRMLVNACYWAAGLEDQIPPSADVALVGPYRPSPIGVNAHKKGVKPADLLEP